MRNATRKSSCSRVEILQRRMVIDRRDTSRVSKGNRSFSRIRDFFFSHDRFMLGCVAALISTLVVDKRLDVAVRERRIREWIGFICDLTKRRINYSFGEETCPCQIRKLIHFHAYTLIKKRVYLQNARKINFCLRLYILILFYLVWTIPT